MSSQSPLGQTLSSAGAFSPFLSPSWLAASQTNKRKGFLLGGQLLTRKLPSAVDMKLVPDCLYLLGFHHRRPVWAATRHPPSSSSSSEHFTKKTLLHLSNLRNVISSNQGQTHVLLLLRTFLSLLVGHDHTDSQGLEHRVGAV